VCFLNVVLTYLRAFIMVRWTNLNWWLVSEATRRMMSKHMEELNVSNMYIYYRNSGHLQMCLWQYIVHFCLLPPAIDCGMPPVLLGATPQFDNKAPTTYTSLPLVYACAWGTWFARDRVKATASCTVNGQWSVGEATDKNKWPSCIGTEINAMLFMFISKLKWLFGKTL